MLLSQRSLDLDRDVDQKLEKSLCNVREFAPLRRRSYVRFVQSGGAFPHVAVVKGPTGQSTVSSKMTKNAVPHKKVSHEQSVKHKMTLRD